MDIIPKYDMLRDSGHIVHNWAVFCASCYISVTVFTSLIHFVIQSDVSYACGYRNGVTCT